MEATARETKEVPELIIPSPDLRVTSNFKLSEFAQQARHGLPAEDYPKSWILVRLVDLCECLEVIRAELGSPLRIVSGYRSPAYNAKIGGARKSQHMEGRAADIQAAGHKANHVHDAILGLISAGKLPKVGGLGRYPGFTHVDCRISGKLVRWRGSRDS